VVAQSGDKLMLPRQYRILAMAIAMIAVAALGGLNRAEASIVLEVSDTAVTDVFYSTSSLFLSTGAPINVGPYTLQGETSVTNYPGDNPSSISTTVNIGLVSGSTAGLPLTVTALIVQDSPTLDLIPGAASGVQVTGANATLALSLPKIAWTSPLSGNGMNIVSANVSSSSTSASGTAVASTYYNSPPQLTSGTGTLATSSLTFSFVTNTPSPATTSVLKGDAPFTMSQSVTATGLANGTAAVNFTAFSQVYPQTPLSVPEPSSFALAGLGALGMIGYGLRRRKALGA
jgi:hypothetical protein